LAFAVTEARQYARDLVAEELRQRPATPLNWRVQVADDEGCIPATLKFAEIVFGTHSSEQSLCAVLDPALVERAKSIFKAQRVQGELRIHVISSQRYHHGSSRAVQRR